MLETLENLESVTIWGPKWELPGKVYLRIKQLHVYCGTDFKISAEPITRQFPNLEGLKNDGSCNETTDSFFITLLGGLKQLKTLSMRIRNATELDPELILQCLQEHGKHLDEANLSFLFHVSNIVQMFCIEKKMGGSFWIRARRRTVFPFRIPKWHSFF